MRFDYEYYADGRLKQLVDLDDQVGQPSQMIFHYMSRQYSYDHVGRTKVVQALPGNIPAPFTGSYGYDAFDNLTSRSWQYGLNTTQTDSATYTNDRRVGWSYDADGRVTASADSATSSTRTWSYDAAGNQITVAETSAGVTTTNTLTYDGDGHLLFESVGSPGSTVSDYLIRSTVLGQC